MYLRTLGAIVCVFLWAGLSHAQFKWSGSGQCAKPEPDYTIEVGDHPGHAFNIQKSTCSWSTQTAIEGLQHQGGSATAFNDISQNKSRYHGIYLDTLSNGDKVTYRYEGAGTVKDGKLASFEEKWTLLSGTGKLKGAKAQGTCKGSGNADGSSHVECQGEFHLVQAGK